MHFRFCIALALMFSFFSTTAVIAQDSADEDAPKILWSADQGLQPGQFTGPVLNDSLSAFAHTGISFEANMPSRRQLNLSLVTTFTPSASYFQTSSDETMVLEREQIRFDLAEVFARRMRKLVQGEDLRKSKILDQLSEILSEGMTDFIQRHNRFNEEVLEDPAQLPKWRSWVDAELNRLEAYAATDMELRLR